MAENKIKWVRRCDLTFQEVEFAGALTPHAEIVYNGVPMVIFKTASGVADEIIRLSIPQILAVTWVKVGQAEAGLETAQINFDLGIGSFKFDAQENVRAGTADLTTVNLKHLNFPVTFCVPRPSGMTLAGYGLQRYNRNDGTLRALISAHNMIAGKNLEQLI